MSATAELLDVDLRNYEPYRSRWYKHPMGTHIELILRDKRRINVERLITSSIIIAGEGRLILELPDATIEVPFPGKLSHALNAFGISNTLLNTDEATDFILNYEAFVRSLHETEEKETPS